MNVPKDVIADQSNVLVEGVNVIPAIDGDEVYVNVSLHSAIEKSVNENEVC